MQHPWHDLDPGADAPEKINVVVEIPKGSRNKYELDKESGLYHLSRVLYSPMIYPGDYGFIPQSFYEDGDPLDILILINEPTFVGCIVEVRPVGIFKMLDKGLPDDKILCVPCHNPFFGNIYDLNDVPPHFLMEVAHFFAVYKDLEGSRIVSLGWDSAEVAHRQIAHSLELYREKYGKAKRSASKQVKQAAKQQKKAVKQTVKQGKESAKKTAAKKAATKGTNTAKEATKKASPHQAAKHANRTLSRKSSAS